jgi:hypothetical protein
MGHRGDVLRLQEPRGFGLEDSQLQRTDRTDRLILIVTLALYRAVSTGMWAATNVHFLPKKAPDSAPKKVARSLTSFLKRGLRRIQTPLQTLSGLPPFWSVRRNGWMVACERLDT